MWIGIVIAVVILIIFYIYVLVSKNNYLQSYLTGMWAATEEFLERAEIEGMFLQLGEQDKNVRRAYLLMHDNNTIVTNRGFDMKFKSSPLQYLTPQITESIDYEVTLTDTEVDENMPLEEIIPLILTLTLYPATNRMILTDGETVYAEMYKTPY